jgi:nicotinate-nucleotide pyrophosphorylase
LTVAGPAFAEAAFADLSSSLLLRRILLVGQQADLGATLMTVSGSARAILTGE